ncbi:MAG TPA: hypothetical protein VFG33_06745 [Kribbella sp.]|uniref:hypothetical protein n=1 Tax=Kribbella sp. TaxID=1871183 RepID=UPI002D786DA5|nr:hypothetical protein [Kribbella sp.]HET6293052.1 hypothetical protein [Kribbella sp.]
MSELKDLSWSVQETVEPLPFEQLERRAVRRRRRRHVIVGIGAAAATAAAVLAVLVPLDQTGQAPVAPEPTKPVQFWPTPSPPKPDTGAAEALIAAPGAQLGSTLMATPTNWAAAWSNCAPQPCRHSAVVKRGAARVVAPVREQPYVVVQAGDEAIALSGPAGFSLTPDDRTWAQTVMVRLTDRGLIETQLHFAKSTKTFSDAEILTTANGEPFVLNLEKSTLRRLEMPAGFATTTSPVRDGTGRWWVVGTEGFSSDIGWTDDGGATWTTEVLDLDASGSTVAVSADGRTVLATSWVDGATLEAIGKVRMSTDAGARWQTVQIPRLARGGGPVAFNDGTARMIGIANDDTTALYGIDSSGSMTKLPGLPDLLDDLSGDGKLLYGPLIQGSAQELLRGPSQNKIATSTDRGLTWRQFEPR